MRREFLRRLHCPYSGSPFSFSQIVEEDTTHIQYGIVTSEAGEFPIVSGILRLQPDEYRLPIVENIREKHLSNALSIALDDGPLHWHGGAAINFAMRLAFRSGFSVAAMRLNRLKRNFTRVITDGSATFKEIAEKLSRGASSGWQVFRFSMPTFLPVFAVSHIVKHDCLILDFGSGTGQASFVIRQMFSGSDIVCADYSFSALYLAQKYFVPSACHTCLDGNYPLPFDSGEFSTVFSSDTLHCIDSKLSLAQEFMRVGSENAVTILPHVHNRQVSPYAKSGSFGMFKLVLFRKKK